MNFLDKRVQRAAESILGNENLTAELNDEAAQVLIDWGVSCAKEIALGTVEILDDEQAEDAMYQPMRALRRMLRTINRWSAKVQALDKDYGPSALEKITEQAAVVYGEKFTRMDASTQQEIINRQDEFSSNPVAYIASLRSAIENPPQRI